MDIIKINRAVHNLANAHEELEQAIENSSLDESEKNSLRKKFNWPEAPAVFDSWNKALDEMWGYMNCHEKAAFLSGVDLDEIDVMFPDEE